MSTRHPLSVTLRDVAAKAGVNTTTVSVVLNNTRSGTRVSEATRARILATAEELGYRPNAAARGMKQRRMNTIGVVDQLRGENLNLYFLEVLNGILDEAMQREQNTTVFSVHDWDADAAKILQFCDGRVDGLIFIGPTFSADFAQKLYPHTPFVALHSNVPLDGGGRIEVDDEQGGYLATRHLIDQGHRAILHVAGPLHLSGPQRRLAGYRRALAEADLSEFEQVIALPAFSSVAALEHVTAWLNANDQTAYPTALFCANDTIASACIDALTTRGIAVPTQMSVVGFDDTLTARMTTPQLTTIRQPFQQLGKRAVTLLLEQLTPSGDDSPSLKEEVFPVQLIARASTAARNPSHGSENV